MLPLAIACVDAECKESWTWFLQVLCEDFGRPQNTGCVFMSDQQKGLIQAFKDLMPNIEITGIEYKKLLWTVASASTQVHFERHMTKLKEFNENAYNWVMQHDSHTWARCFFSTHTKFDALQNNICESFNAYIRKTRGLPILKIFECITKKLMQ